MPRIRPAREASARNAVDSRWVARRTAQHLENLERSNYNDTSGGGNSAAQLAQRRKEAEEEATLLNSRKKLTGTNAVKILLMYRKPLEDLIQESLCSICGFRGHYSCMRCAMRYCSIACKTTHDEMRCERRGR